MITAEIKVNGALIGFLYIRRDKDPNFNAGNTEATYKVEYYSPEVGKIAKFDFNYDPRNGAEQMISKLMETVAIEYGSRQV